MYDFGPEKKNCVNIFRRQFMRPTHSLLLPFRHHGKTTNLGYGDYHTSNVRSWSSCTEPFHHNILNAPRRIQLLQKPLVGNRFAQEGRRKSCALRPLSPELQLRSKHDRLQTGMSADALPMRSSVCPPPICGARPPRQNNVMQNIHLSLPVNFGTTLFFHTARSISAAEGTRLYSAAKTTTTTLTRKHHQQTKQTHW